MPQPNPAPVVALTPQQINDTTAKLASISALTDRWQSVLGQRAMLDKSSENDLQVVNVKTGSHLGRHGVTMATLRAAMDADLAEVYAALQTAYNSY